MRAVRRWLSAYGLVGVLGYSVYGDDTAGDLLLGACDLPHLLLS
jgi:hypothetical protein